MSSGYCFLNRYRYLDMVGGIAASTGRPWEEVDAHGQLWASAFYPAYQRSKDLDEASEKELNVMSAWRKANLSGLLPESEWPNRLT